MDGQQNQNQSQYLMETDRKRQYLTQDIYDQNQDTAPINRKKNIQNQKGYLGEIAFSSKIGDKNFRLYKDSSLGFGQKGQNILIDQDWDEDIETDNSCAEKAVQKCIKQLYQALRHQRRGIDPTSPFVHDYTTLGERYFKENQLINQDRNGINQNCNQDRNLKISDSPLIQSKSQIMIQMQGMMNQIDIQQSYLSQQQQINHDILGQETKRDFMNTPIRTKASFARQSDSGYNQSLNQNYSQNL
ncbi:hypothetical protein TTHERM_00046930 (macronuclear) [Tetrahymena thermophila SB210]|uniref:Uncharacterized protein n=1 Tax=Tetrahymena thermophila (strain SB210) TaxID=312017 RepID=Q23DJ8_TETTS|nr:hypothetical protein TTHERM_00046930 [Tetrahymena thermophila SB210]EAR94707.3 hypothetical protein TTHERM_00046930 [Tetrahymena thermophila SB210]|eukprot:XP_001014688.3 hypothetical protein TTHERM_00046930 [Tetrahymena thermophila SB210]